VDWRGSEVQPGAEFYAAIDAALQKLDKEAGAGE
jgi:ribosome-associated translation inhibitor RaiA